MEENQINMEELIKINGVKREAYNSRLIEPIKIVNKDEKTAMEIEGNKTPIMTKEDRNAIMNSDALKNENGNIYLNSQDGKMHVPTGEKPRFVSDLRAIEEANKKLEDGTWGYVGNLAASAAVGVTSAAVAAKNMSSLPAKVAVGAIGTAVSGEILSRSNGDLTSGLGVALHKASVYIATAASAIGLVPSFQTKLVDIGLKAVAAGAGAGAAYLTVEPMLDSMREAEQEFWNEMGIKNLKEDFDKEVVNKIKSNESSIDLNSLFSDPYVDTLGLYVDRTNEDGKYFFDKSLRNNIYDFEAKKEVYSETLNTIIQTYDKYSKMGGKEEELTNLKKEFNDTVKSFNEFKNTRIQEISQSVELLQRETQGELKNVLMDYKTFNKLKELSFLDNNLITINKPSKLEGINEIYGKNEIDKIKGSARMLELGISNGVLLSEVRVSNHHQYSELKKLVQTIGNEAANFDNLSQVEQKELLNKYKELGTQLNSYVKSSVEFIEPSKASLVAHIGKKDFIDVKQIDDISKKLGLDNIEIVQNEKKYEQEVTKKEVSSLADIGKF